VKGLVVRSVSAAASVGAFVLITGAGHKFW
jgi:hypothetical protein